MNNLSKLGLALLLSAGTALAQGKPFKLNFGDWGGTGIGKLRAKAPSERTLLPECTAFLSGPKQITTAGHCGEFGVEGLEFVLHYKNGSGLATLALSDVFTTGGGFGKNEERSGWDWMHVMLKDVPPAVGQGGKAVKPFELSNDADETKTGAETYLVSYRSDVEKGEEATWQQCKVEDPPETAKDKYCDKVGKGPDGKNLYECNFFNLDCPPAPEGLDSGSPVFGASGKVVGILAGRSTLDGKLVAWVVTANESRKPAGNPYFHWLNLKRYVEFEALIESMRFVARDFDANNAKDKGLENYSSLLVEWQKLGVADRFKRIQQWDTVAGQELVAGLNAKVKEQVAAGRRADVGILLPLPDKEKLVARAENQFGQHYELGLPVSNEKMVAARSLALKQETTRVALLAEKKKESEALANTERDRDKKNFRTLVTNTQKRTERMLADWKNIAPTADLSYYRARAAEIDAVSPDADKYTKEQLKTQVAWLEARGEWLGRVEDAQKDHVLAATTTRVREAQQQALLEAATRPAAPTYRPAMSPPSAAPSSPTTAYRAPATEPFKMSPYGTPAFDREWAEARRQVEQNHLQALREQQQRAAPPSYAAPRPAMTPPPAAPSYRNVTSPSDPEWIEARRRVEENLRRAQGR